jgi:hypothetical protein
MMYTAKNWVWTNRKLLCTLCTKCSFRSSLYSPCKSGKYILCAVYIGMPNKNKLYSMQHQNFIVHTWHETFIFRELTLVSCNIYNMKVSCNMTWHFVGISLITQSCLLLFFSACNYYIGIQLAAHFMSINKQ